MTDSRPMTSTDHLIAQIASNDADAPQWARFEQCAASEPTAWESLARALRDEIQMRCALDDETAVADAVEIPESAFTRSPIAIRHSLGRWGGWAMAAAIALAWAGLSFILPREAPPQPMPAVAGEVGGSVVSPGAVLASYSTPDHAYRDYLRLGAQEGRIVQELPMVMIDSRTVSAAGTDDEPVMEVLYVRQVLERTRVNGAFRLDIDDAGRAMPVKVDFAALRREDPL